MQSWSPAHLLPRRVCGNYYITLDAGHIDLQRVFAHSNMEYDTFPLYNKCDILWMCKNWSSMLRGWEHFFQEINLHSGIDIWNQNLMLGDLPGQNYLCGTMPIHIKCGRISLQSMASALEHMG